MEEREMTRSELHKAKLETFSKLRANGLSFGKIAKYTGFSRSAVAGVLWREDNKERVKKYKEEYKEL